MGSSLHCFVTMVLQPFPWTDYSAFLDAFKKHFLIFSA